MGRGTGRTDPVGIGPPISHPGQTGAFSMHPALAPGALIGELTGPIQFPTDGTVEVGTWVRTLPR